MGVDYDAAGQVVGMAIEMASAKVDLDVAEAIGLPNVQVRAHVPQHDDAAAPLTA